MSAFTGALFDGGEGIQVADPFEAVVTQDALKDACRVSRETIRKWGLAGLEKYRGGYRLLDVLAWLASERQRLAGGGGETGSDDDEDENAKALKDIKLQEEIRKLKLANEKESKNLIDVGKLNYQFEASAEILKKELEDVARVYDCENAILRALDKYESDLRALFENGDQK